jgi:PST family polysaccharide transporter
MTATADVLIPYLLGEDWRGAVPIFQALGFAGLLQPMNNTAGWLFISQGRSGEFLQLGIVGTVICILAFIIGLPFGAFGVAAVYAASEFIRTPIVWWYAARRGPIGARDVLGTVLPHLVGAAVSLGGGMAIRAVLPASQMAALLTALPLSYALSLSTILLFQAGRETVWQSISLARRSWRRASIG